MSFQAMAWATSQRAGSPAAKCLLLALANYADADGTCWPSMAKLADDAEMSVSTVKVHLAKLRERGLITWERRQHPGGLWKSNHYALQINPPAPPQPDPGPSPSDRPNPDGQGPANGSQDPATGWPGSGYREPVMEPENLSPPPPPFGGGRPPAAAEGPKTAEPVPVQASTRTRRATRLPDDWEPSEALLEWVRRECPGLRRSENDKFVDYWRAAPGQRGTKLDWDATWRNWMRKAYESMPSGRGVEVGPRGPVEGPGGITMSRRVAEFLGAAERRRERQAAQLSLLASHPAPNLRGIAP